MTPERLEQIQKYAEAEPEMDYEADIRQMVRDALEENARLKAELAKVEKQRDSYQVTAVKYRDDLRNKDRLLARIWKATEDDIVETVISDHLGSEYLHKLLQELAAEKALGAPSGEKEQQMNACPLFEIECGEGGVDANGKMLTGLRTYKIDGRVVSKEEFTRRYEEKWASREKKQ